MYIYGCLSTIYGYIYRTTLRLRNGDANLQYCQCFTHAHLFQPENGNFPKKTPEVSTDTNGDGIEIDQYQELCKDRDTKIDLNKGPP